MDIEDFSRIYIEITKKNNNNKESSDSHIIQISVTGEHCTENDCLPIIAFQFF